MKIEIRKYNGFCCSNDFYCSEDFHEISLNQQEYDYIFKNLDFEKLYYHQYIYFNSEETEQWFYNHFKSINGYSYINSIKTKNIKAYNWIKRNWCNGMYKIFIYYLDKKEFKKCVNRYIKIEIERRINNEN